MECLSSNANNLKTQALQGRQNSWENYGPKTAKYATSSHYVNPFNTLDADYKFNEPLKEAQQFETGNLYSTVHKTFI